MWLVASLTARTASRRLGKPDPRPFRRVSLHLRRPMPRHQLIDALPRLPRPDYNDIT